MSLFEQSIGTPGAKSSLKVMLLGGGELGKEVVISLQRYGVETIVVDRYKNAPAMQVAHHSAVIDMTNSISLSEVIESFQPNIIIPEIEAIHTDTLLELEKNTKVVVIPNANAVRITMNRELIRELAATKLGLATSKFAFADNYSDLVKHSANIGFPCIIKPIMSSSGKGQSLVKSGLELKDAWEHALNAGRVNHNRVIIEELIKFDFEITLLTIRAYDINGNIQTYFCDPIGHRQVNGDYVESWQPQKMSVTALKKSHEIADKITTALGGVGVFGVELFISDDQVWFSEVSPRPHDTGMVTMITQAQNEFELHARAILGLPVDPSIQTPGATSVIYGQAKTDNLSFANIAQALSITNSQIRLFGKPESWSKRRVGVALVANNDIKEARFLAQECANRVKLIN